MKLVPGWFCGDCVYMILEGRGQHPLDTLDGIYGEDPRSTASPDIGRDGTEAFVEVVIASVAAAMEGLDT